MQIDSWTLALQTVNALVLIWLLSRFLFRPVASILAARKAAAERLMDEAAAAKSAAQELEAKAHASLEQIAADRAAAIRCAAAEAEGARQDMLAAARSEAEGLRTQAQAEIERLKKTERRAETERASLLAVDIAQRLLDRLPQASRVAGFVEGLGQAIAALSESARAEFGRSGAVLSAPRPLTLEEETLCRRELEKAFGRPLVVTIRADPNLLAGLELEDERMSVRNSLRADLDRISEKLLAESENGG